MIPAPPASIGPVFSVMDWDSQSKICWEKHLNGEKNVFFGCISCNSMSISYLYKSICMICVCVGSAKNINKSTKRWENLRFKLRNLRGSYSAREFPRPRHIRNPHRASAFCRCSEVAFPDEASEMMMLMMNQKKQDVLVIKNEKWWVLSLEWTFTGEHC